MFYGEKRSSTYSLCGLGFRTTLVKGQSSHLQKGINSMDLTEQLG